MKAAAETAAALASTDVSNIFSSVCTIGANHSFRHHTSIVPDTGVLHRNAADEISRSFEDTGILQVKVTKSVNYKSHFSSKSINHAYTNSLS
uniref:Uncharacterized protein n=1 Tax=Rhipicephalus zambeziensis TaxID=60191 RepID=A0A224Y6Z4_9ACAR